MPMTPPHCPWCGSGVGNNHFAKDCPYGTANPLSPKGVSHDFSCTHDPCRCRADQIIWWCENHKASASNDGWFADELRCHVWWWGEAHPDIPLLDPYACSVVSRLLTEPPNEEAEDR